VPILVFLEFPHRFLLEFRQLGALHDCVLDFLHAHLDLRGQFLDLPEGLDLELLLLADGGLVLLDFLAQLGGFLLVVVAQASQLLLVVLELLRVGLEEELVLVVDMAVAFELELQLGVVALQLLQLVGQLAQLAFSFIGKFLQEVVLLLELVQPRVEGFQVPRPLLLLVQSLGQFGQFLVLLEHEGAQTIVLLG
jgi:hypothetical protein